MDVPLYKAGKRIGKEKVINRYINRDALELGLDSLRWGYDSLQIRVWLGHSLGAKHVIILKYENNTWKGQVINFGKVFDDSGNIVTAKIAEHKSPKSGWNSFTKRLFALDILTLPHEDDVIGYESCGLDGNPFHFEWATTKKYRLYSYCNPDGNVKKFWQARNVLKIAELLETEFDFEYTK
jgi:hypothetical protein